jgi:hypothetical protein
MRTYFQQPPFSRLNPLVCSYGIPGLQNLCILHQGGTQRNFECFIIVRYQNQW